MSPNKLPSRTCFSNSVRETSFEEVWVKTDKAFCIVSSPYPVICKAECAHLFLVIYVPSVHENLRFHRFSDFFEVELAELFPLGHKNDCVRALCGIVRRIGIFYSLEN